MKAVARLMSVPKERRDPAWVQEALQAAVQLELSTLPPYLYALWSIEPNPDPEHDPDPFPVQETIRSIVLEEMLHMGIACNLLVAVGSTPDIVANAPAFPAQLPKHIHKGLVVDLAPLSAAAVHTFMEIEEPEAHLVVDPNFTPTGDLLIGQFYEGLIDALKATSQTFSTDGQIDLNRGQRPFTESFVISSLDGARRAVDVIRRQGEGTAAVPFENKSDPEELAHFYQFGEILNGRRLTREAPFTYTGDPVPMPRVRDVRPAPAGRPEALAFDRAYSTMLASLQLAWENHDLEALGDAIFGESGMFSLRSLAEDVFATGAGPGFRVVPVPGEEPVEPPAPPAGNRFGQVTRILDAAVGPAPFGAHGAFWRGITRDQFIAKIVAGEQLLVVGDGPGSNLVKALRGQSPFGSDTGTVGADLPRMPADRDPVPDADIAVIERWIDDGCPDTAAQTEPDVSNTTGSFRPDPQVHVDYFRDLDEWAAFNRPPGVEDAVNVVFGFRRAWLAYAEDATREPGYVTAISGATVRQAVTMLADRQQQTVETHYGVPVPLLAVLDGYERFGNDGLPPDPLRPSDPQHRMNGREMWFLHAAFAEACVRLGIAVPFWTFMMRPILCGLLNDGLFRGRFTVVGFEATPAGRDEVFAFAQSVADADLPAELRKRFAESGLAGG
ncbi:ferritin-like domain-containing protein [Pseudonocardia saturnea]